MRILAVSGSIQSDSANLALLETAIKVAPTDVKIVICDGLRQLPHFNPDLEASGPPAAVAEWRKALAECDAVLIASPEYGFSLPGVLKNGIDWVIGSGELERKVIAITESVNHSDRGHRGLQALRETLTAVSAKIVGGKPTVRGSSFNTDVAALVQATVTAAMGQDG